MLTTRELSKKILIIALPASLQFIVNQLQISTDMAFIGHYSAEGLSAIQNARVAFFLLLAFFLAFTNGTNILVAQHLGARDPRQAQRLAETSLFYNHLLSLGYLVFWLVCGKAFLTLLGAQGEILRLSANYVRIVSVVFLAEGLILTANAIFQGRGHTVPITISAIIRTCINIPLDWALIYGNWGFPELGVEGAALATMVSELAGGLFLILLLFRDQRFPINIRQVLRPAAELYAKVVKLGFPNGLEFMIWAAGSTGLLALLNAVSPEAAGHFGVTHVIKIFNLSIYFGLGVATMTLVGMAVGGRDPVMARRTSVLTISFSFIICAMMGTLYALFPGQIIGLFMRDPAVIQTLQAILYIVSLTLFPQAYNVVGGNALRARGDAKWLLYVQIVGVALILPMAYLAMFRLQLGLEGLLWVILIDETWRACVNAARIRYHSTRERRRLPDNAYSPV